MGRRFGLSRLPRSGSQVGRVGRRMDEVPRFLWSARIGSVPRLNTDTLIIRQGFKSHMAKILWGSEQPIRPTGYATVSREVIKRLVKDYDHEVFVMGWDYNGENMTHDEGWTMVHAGLGFAGTERLNGADGPTILDYHLDTIRPDVYLSLIDPWFIGQAVLSTNQRQVPYIAYTPVDGYPLSYQWSRIFGHVHTPLWMSEFGRDQMREFVKTYGTGGTAHESMLFSDLDRYADDPGPMIYHGVDLDVFKPASSQKKEELRKRLGIEWETVILSVGRNTNRKQIPRLLEAMRIVVDRLGEGKVGLVLHCGDPTDTMGMGGWKLPDLVKQMGLTGSVVFSDNNSNPLHGLSREELASLYRMADAHALATGGEGFGIPSAEAMACGLPIILPDNSTGPELVGSDRGWLIGSDTHITGPKWGVNMTLASIDELAEAIIEVHADPKKRRAKGKAARKWAEEHLDWDHITKQFHDLIVSRVGMPHPLGPMRPEGTR